MVAGGKGTNHAGDCRHLISSLLRPMLLPPAPWDENTWPAWTNAVKTKTGRKGKELFMPLRLALTGADHGPEMKVLLPMIGPERVKHKIIGRKAA